jgi:hypothetical protein
MRKTARPVVWEGAGPQSTSPDPIDPAWRRLRAQGTFAVLRDPGLAPISLAQPSAVASEPVFP